MYRSTDIAHMLLRRQLQPGDWVVDATLGNGHDALFLKQCVGGEGRVFGFDTQGDAIRASHHLFVEAEESLDAVEFFERGHEEMSSWLPPESRGKIACVMFNLGYLPHGDPVLITQTVTTLQAIEAAKEFVAGGGSISLVAYPGHSGGAEEGEAAKQLMLSWRPQWRLYEYRCLSAETPAPYLLFAVKARGVRKSS